MNLKVLLHTYIYNFVISLLGKNGKVYVDLEKAYFQKRVLSSLYISFHSKSESCYVSATQNRLHKRVSQHLSTQTRLQQCVPQLVLIFTSSGASDSNISLYVVILSCS